MWSRDHSGARQRSTKCQPCDISMLHMQHFHVAHATVPWPSPCIVCTGHSVLQTPCDCIATRNQSQLTIVVGDMLKKSDKEKNTAIWCEYQSVTFLDFLTENDHVVAAGDRPRHKTESDDNQLMNRLWNITFMAVILWYVLISETSHSWRLFFDMYWSLKHHIHGGYSLICIDLWNITFMAVILWYVLISETSHSWRLFFDMCWVYQTDSD